MGKRVLVVGGGGREHALAWTLARSATVAGILCAPGNPGTAALAENVAVRADDVEGLVRLAVERSVDLVVVGPEGPLALGLADRLRAAGVATVGHSRAATRLESSKVWSKGLMGRAGVPTARYAAYGADELGAAIAALDGFDERVVIKADGLAAGKGVVVADSREEARAAVTAFLGERTLGAAGGTVVIEERLSGPEVSIIALTDGMAIRTLLPSRDHKRAHDGDAGPNTGGMGAFAGTALVDDPLLAEIERTILRPVVDAMREEGCPLRGVLYAGLMLTPDGPRVLEFNVRLGDPEAQAILPALRSDLGELLAAVADGTLADAPPVAHDGRSHVVVVVASGGYPGEFTSGHPITGLDAVGEDATVFHAGTARRHDGALVTAGGRVLTVAASGDTLAEARDRAYAARGKVTFDGAWSRSDIALSEVGR